MHSELQRPDFVHLNVPGKSKRTNSIHEVTNVHTCKITALAVVVQRGRQKKSLNPNIRNKVYKLSF